MQALSIYNGITPNEITAMFINSSSIILVSLDKKLAVKMAGFSGTTRWNVYVDNGDNTCPDWRIVSGSGDRDAAIEAFNRIQKVREVQP